MKQHDSQLKSAFGEDLAKLRRVKNLTLEKVAALTKIQARYLDRLEKGEFAKLPADVYVRGMLAKYAKTIDADFEELWKRFEDERNISGEAPSGGKSRKGTWSPRDFTSRKGTWSPRDFTSGKIARRSGIFDHLPRNRFLNASLFVLTPKLIIISSLALILFFIFGYLVYQFNFLVGPPSLSVFEPSEDVLTTDKKIKLAGLVEVGAILTINGQPAGLDSDGRFEEELALQPGVNVIEFLAKNHLGKTAVVKRTVVLSATSSAVDSINTSESGESDSSATSTY